MRYALLGLLAHCVAFAFVFGARALGQFLAARRAGVGVAQLILGAGPSLREWRSEGAVPLVELRAFPFFVRLVLAGVSPENRATPGAFAAASDRARFMVVLAGLLPVYGLLFSCAFAAQVGAGGQMKPSNLVSVISDGEADRAGIKNGDRIVEVRGEPTPSWSDVRKAINASEGGSLGLTIERADQRVSVLVTPVRSPSGSWVIGVLFKNELEPVAMRDSALTALALPWTCAAARLGPALGHPVKGEQGEVVLPWPWSAAFLVSQMLAIWFFVLSLPLPALDGGKLLALAAEALTGRRFTAGTWARIESARLLLVLWVVVYFGLLVSAALAEQ